MGSKRKISVVLLGLACCASGATAQSLLLGPKGEFKTNFIGSKLEYDPGKGCYKPNRPFTDDRFSRDMYRNEAERYLSCLEDAAEADLRYVRLVVQDGYETAAQDFLNEVERGY